MHIGVGGEIIVYPPFKIFAILANKSAIKHPNGEPAPQKISQPLYTLPPKICQKPHGPSPWIFKPCASRPVFLNQGSAELLCSLSSLQGFRGI